MNEILIECTTMYDLVYLQKYHIIANEGYHKKMAE